MEVFCTRLKAHREQRGWNQSELARRAGVPSQVISRLESGVRVGLTLDVARRLARALGLSLDILAGTWDEPTDEALAALQPMPPRPPARRKGRPPQVPAGTPNEGAPDS